jgi:hypothetical protein
MTLSPLGNLRRCGIAACVALTLAAIPMIGHADPVLVNGNFESLGTPGQSALFGTGQSQQVTGWTTNGYNFVFTPGAADTTGATNGLKLWGPGTGSANGLTGSPAGGNFLALDGVYETSPVSQTITGLTPGATETVSFYYAGAQQSGYTSSTTEGLIVSLGSQSDETAILNNVAEGFTGWNEDSFTFTATSASETLSFLAVGTPSGVPPMTLLDGVTLSETAPVPEPGSLALLSTGLIGLGGFVRSRFSKRS